MYFKTSEKHEALRAQIREFAEAEIKPFAFQWDTDNEFPREVIKKMAQKGWMGIHYPKEYGGAGLDIISYAIAVEELAHYIAYQKQQVYNQLIWMKWNYSGARKSAVRY